MNTRFRNYAWGVLAYNLGVIAWGAYVRATGSGAGCGSHWPTCQGAIVPRSPTVETLVEYSHRTTSGLALLLTVGLVAWAFRAYARGSAVRKAATASIALMIAEALLGAGLVLFGLVADNASVARAWAMSLHLVNTFLLLGAIALTAWFASGGLPFRIRGQGALGPILGAGVAAVIVLGVSGAITALGDTLFPAGSLAEGISQDFAPTAHILIRLRVLHPMLAIGIGIYLAVAALAATNLRVGGPVRALAGVLVGLFLVQLAAGAVNLILLAPVWMQLVHLVLADLVWLALVLLVAASFAQPRREAAPATGAGRTQPSAA